MLKAGAHVHAYCAPGAVAYSPLILTEKTSWTIGVVGTMHLITVISSRHLPYLHTQDGVFPRIPSNYMTSPHPCSICLHSFLLVSQSAFSIQSAFQILSGHTPTECINCGTCCIPFILTLTIRQTTPPLNHSLHQHPSAVSACTH